MARQLLLVLLLSGLLVACASPMPSVPFPRRMIDAIHGPVSESECLKWFSAESALGNPGSVAWRKRDPRHGDTAAASEYRTDLSADEVYYVCRVCPYHLTWDLDGDRDVDLRDYCEAVRRWGE